MTILYSLCILTKAGAFFNILFFGGRMDGIGKWRVSVHFMIFAQDFPVFCSRPRWGRISPQLVATWCQELQGFWRITIKPCKKQWIIITFFAWFFAN